MATTSSTPTAGMSGGRGNLKAKLATGAAILGCVAALASAGAGVRAAATAAGDARPSSCWPWMRRRCVYTSAAGSPGRGAARRDTP